MRKPHFLDVQRLASCAKCQRGVESVVEFHDILSRRHVFEIHCHGEIEEFSFTEQALLEGRWRLSPTTFFRENKQIAQSGDSFLSKGRVGS